MGCGVGIAVGGAYLGGGARYLLPLPLPTLYAVPAALRSSSVLPTVATCGVRVRVRVRVRARVRVRVRVRVSI